MDKVSRILHQNYAKFKDMAIKGRQVSLNGQLRNDMKHSQLPTGIGIP